MGSSYKDILKTAKSAGNNSLNDDNLDLKSKKIGLKSKGEGSRDNQNDIVTMNMKLERKYRTYWLGKIKGEGLSYKSVVCEYLAERYGLPDED